jgi:hypothetical protein
MLHFVSDYKTNIAIKQVGEFRDGIPFRTSFMLY